MSDASICLCDGNKPNGQSLCAIPAHRIAYLESEIATERLTRNCGAGYNEHRERDLCRTQHAGGALCSECAWKAAMERVQDDVAAARADYDRVVQTLAVANETAIGAVRERDAEADNARIACQNRDDALAMLTAEAASGAIARDLLHRLFFEVNACAEAELVRTVNAYLAAAPSPALARIQGLVEALRALTFNQSVHPDWFTVKASDVTAFRAALDAFTGTNTGDGNGS